MTTQSGNGNRKRIGVLGGTFDPAHNGHLAIAGEARKVLRLDEVLFVPAGQPWMKAGQAITPAEHRLAMLRLAVRGKPHFKVSTIELEREGPTYTVETLEELRSQYRENTEIYFIMGQDALPEFPRWRQPVRIIELATLAIFPRLGYPPPDLDALDTQLPGLKRRVVLLDSPLVDVSATEIRRRVVAGESLRGLVPAPVAAYIGANGLYRG